MLYARLIQSIVLFKNDILFNVRILQCLVTALFSVVNLYLVVLDQSDLYFLPTERFLRI